MKSKKQKIKDEVYKDFYGKIADPYSIIDRAMDMVIEGIFEDIKKIRIMILEHGICEIRLEDFMKLEKEWNE